MRVSTASGRETIWSPRMAVIAGAGCLALMLAPSYGADASTGAAISKPVLLLPDTNPGGSEVEESRIVGGRLVNDAKQNPGAVLLSASGQQHCTGSRIGPTWVLSARHCKKVPPEVGNQTFNIDGVWTDSVQAMRGHKARVKRTIEAPNSDMLLIELAENAPGPIAPWSATPLKAGDKVTFWGWGGTNAQSDPSSILKAGDGSFTGLSQSQYFGGREAVYKCNGGCPWKGDSGGPVTMNGKVVGACSWSGSMGTDANSETGYPATSEQASWIQQTTGIAPDSAPGGTPNPTPTTQPTQPPFPPTPTGQPTRPPRPTGWPTRPAG